MRLVIYTDSKGREKTLKVKVAGSYGWLTATDDRAYWINTYKTAIYREWGNSFRRLGKIRYIAG